MKILLLTQYYYPCIGGVETYVRQMAQEFAKVHQVSVAAVNFAPCQLPERIGVLHTSLLTPSYASHWDGSVYVHALTPTLFDRFKMLPIVVRATPRLQRYAYVPLRQFGYSYYYSAYASKLRTLMQGVDIVHCHAVDYLGWAAQAVAQELGIQFVCTPYVHPHECGDDAANVEYQKRSQAVITLTPTNQKYLLSLGIPTSKLHVIGVAPDVPPTVDAESFRQQHNLQNVPIVLYIGRMTPYKGAKALLDARELVWKVAPEARFVFIGPMTKESSAWFEIADHRVLYLGRISQQEKANAIAACDIFCMPSLSEILPTVYVEAWNYAKPVIAGLAEGLSELVTGNHAGINVSQAAEEIAAAVNQLLLDPKLRERYGQNGKALVEEHYTVQKIAQKHIQLYDDLLTKSKKSAQLKALSEH